MSATCCQPGFTTMFERVKIANVIKVIGMQIFSASYIVFRKDAFAMRAQSLAATSQARLLLGPANVVRIDPTLVGPPIELDDYRRAMDELLPAVLASVAAHRDRVEEIFLKIKAERFVPVPWTE